MHRRTHSHDSARLRLGSDDDRGMVMSMHRLRRGPPLLFYAALCLPRRHPTLRDLRFACGLHRVHFGVMLALPFTLMPLLRNTLSMRKLLQFGKVQVPFFFLLRGQPDPVPSLCLKIGGAGMVMFFCRRSDGAEGTAENDCEDDGKETHTP